MQQLKDMTWRYSVSNFTQIGQDTGTVRVKLIYTMEWSAAGTMPIFTKMTLVRELPYRISQKCDG